MADTPTTTVAKKKKAKRSVSAGQLHIQATFMRPGEHLLLQALVLAVFAAPKKVRPMQPK